MAQHPKDAVDPPRVPLRRKRSARFSDIAQEAGVSEATVDRVLNERGSVSAAARERVVAAAARLGARRQLPDVRHGLVHVDVLLPVNRTPFYTRLDLALQRAIHSLDRHIVVHRLRVGELRDDEYTKAILAPRHPRAGLIIAGPSTPGIVAALQDVAARGEPVVTMVSDVPEVARRSYVGIDNYRAGRTAGHVLALANGGRGELLVLPALRGYRAHAERVQGCCDEIGEYFPEYRVIVADEDTLDDPAHCFRLMQRALRRHAITAVYNTGDGAAGIEAALRRVKPLGRMAWAGHEIEDDHRRLLEARAMNVAIDQDPDGQAMSALQHLLRQADASRLDATGREFSVFLPTNARAAAYL